jgi:hypothetical protein
MILKQHKENLIFWAHLAFFVLISQVITACINIDKIEYENIQRVRKIDVRKVEKIEISLIMLNNKDVQDKYKKQLEDKKDILNFVRCLRTLQPVNTNHPQYRNKWGVKIILNGMENEELKLMQRRGDEKNIYVRCLGHQWIGSAADAISSDLYDWMDNNIGLPRLE